VITGLKPGHEERPLISHAALHAEELSLGHPVTGVTVILKKRVLERTSRRGEISAAIRHRF